MELGGQALAWSNRHYGHPRNLIAPGRGNCMGDGWETARQPARPAVYEKGADGLMVLPGYDWALLRLGNKLYLYSMSNAGNVTILNNSCTTFLVSKYITI